MSAHHARCGLCGSATGTLNSAWPDAQPPLPDICGPCVVGAVGAAADVLHASYNGSKAELARACGDARRMLREVAPQRGEGFRPSKYDVCACGCPASSHVYRNKRWECTVCPCRALNVPVQD